MLFRSVHSAEQYLATPSGAPGKLGAVPGQPSKLEQAQARLLEQQKKLAEAEKDLRNVGKTQWDIPLIKQSIADIKSEIKKAKASERTGLKRASTIEEATTNLLTDMVAAKNQGRKVEYFNPRTGKWSEVQSLSMNNIKLAEEGELQFTPEKFQRAVFRVNAGTGSVTPVRVYGKPLYLQQWSDIPLELRDAAFDGKASNFKT